MFCDEEHRYDDIINLPHHISKMHKPMSAEKRAAQFSAFAALSGYEAAVAESGRLTDKKLVPDEDRIAEIDFYMNTIIDMADQQPEISVTYFVPDERKAGGSYEKVTGNFRCFDEYNRLIILTDDTRIPLDDVYHIECQSVIYKIRGAYHK